MKVLIIQENGRHQENRHLRECFSMQRAFQFLEVKCDVWGLGHHVNPIDDPTPDFESYDLIINLENYDETGWVPDLSEVRNPLKFLWAIDSHARGHEVYAEEFKRGKYDLILQATKFFVDENSIWLPNAYDDDLLRPLSTPKIHNTGFCGNIHNREGLLHFANDNWGCKLDVMVLGPKMVEAINSYKVHMNANIGSDINYRNFETLGCGTVLAAVAYNFEQEVQYEDLGFVNGENCILLGRNSTEDIIASISAVIDDDDARIKMEQAGLELAKKHTYKERAKTIIELWQKEKQ